MGISKDMKYTALYWTLRFVETELDVHKKSYNGYEVTIYAEEQAVDFGERIKCSGRYPEKQGPLFDKTSESNALFSNFKDISKNKSNCNWVKLSEYIP